MAKEQELFEKIPLFISCSNISTEVNKTGSWRFMRPRYDEKTAPCAATCPAGEDIGRIEMLATQGLFKKAWETILMENPFPAVCGRVCFHPCENACNRSELDEPIAVHSLERFLGDTALLEGMSPSFLKLPLNGKKVAIAGAGPAGLSAAYFLSLLGYACDVFEAQKEPGGLLRWGIPAYRLPDNVLKDEIKRIENQGVKIHCKKLITKNLLKEIKNKYDAFFIGCGHSRTIQMKIPGEKVAMDGLEFLCKIRNGKMTSIHEKAAVIGGGNTAIDVARSLVRLGTIPVMVYRRRKQDMPAFKHEVEMAIKEGVEIKELFAPVRIEEKNGGYILTLQKMKIGDKDIKGRASVVPDGFQTQTLWVQNIFTAIGAEAGESWHLPPEKNDKILNLSHCTLICEDLPIVYGGDLTNSIKSVTDAIASGKQAAMALDTFFQNGWGSIEERLASCRVGTGPSHSMEIYMGGEPKIRNPHVVSYNEINTDYFQPLSRVIQPSLSAEKRSKSFSEIDFTLSADMAVKEAQRCFNCGICNECDNCRLFCPEVAVILEGNMRRINLDYCKGCGICVVECPRSAMVLEEEKI